MQPSVRRWCLSWALLGAAVLASPAAAAPPLDTDLQARALHTASEAVVGVRTRSVEDARSATTLGRQRQGSGVVIGADDLVLTIGYLVLEAESVELDTGDGARIPARVVAYDLATGFGLVQALAPLRREPVPLGSSAAAAAAGEPMVVVSGGADGRLGIARLLSRRDFSGYWEYHVEGALFTAPPRRDHSGSALFNARGELLGIGSLLLADANGSKDEPVAGNMFVPIDLLRPILGELRQRGSSRASTRAWLGVNCIELDGEVRVLRISDDSPADVAGLQPGDRIVRIDGTEVGALDKLWKALWAGDAAAERSVTLDIQRGGAAQTLTVHAVDRAKTLRRARGI